MGRGKAEEGQFPFFTINSMENNGENWLCSGSLIDENWAVVPANCLFRSGWDISNLKIQVGVGKIHPEDESGEWVGVLGYKVHPDFDFPYNNLALLNIESPESFSNDAVCFQNEGTYSTCFPSGILCASVGMNRDGAIIVRPVVSQPSDKVNLRAFNTEILHPIPKW